METFIKDEYYKFIFESSLDGIMLTCPDGNIYRANPAACEMFQRTEQEIIEVGRDGVVDMEDPRLCGCLREREEKGKAKGELNFIRKDGTTFPVSFTSVISKDAHGKLWAGIIFRDITQRKKAESIQCKRQEECEHMASYDYLTGVLNRRGFMEKLEQEMVRSKRDNLPTSLIIADIDFFKGVNDQYGHLTGDQILKMFAQQIGDAVRPYDIVGRYGGDEFIICMPNSTREVATLAAERLREKIEEITVMQDAKKIKVTASFGVASYDALFEEGVGLFISRVDDNMYKAKENRNSVYSSDR